MEENLLPEDDEKSLLDYLIVILKRKKFILKWTTVITLLVAVIVFLMPNTYVGEVRFMPPAQSSSVAVGILSQAMGGGLAGLAGSALGMTTPGDMYVGLLSSRTVLDNIVDRFDLVKRYDRFYYLQYYREDARKKLTDDIMTASNDSTSGVVTLDIEDKDPKVAAAMANAFFEELQNLSKGLAITDAQQRRLFYEKEVKNTKEALTKAEDDMRSFEEKTGALAPDAQATAVITGDAAVRAEIAAKEVEISVMKTYSTPQNPDLQKAEESLRGMKAQQAKLERSTGTGFDPLMPAGRMPSVGLEYARKMRDVKYYEALYEILVKQYELARLDESKEGAVIQLVDKAVAPEKKSKPKRILDIILAAIGGFFLTVVMAFFQEYKENGATNPETSGKFDLVRTYSRFRKKK